MGVRAGGVATAVLLMGGLGWSQSGDLAGAQSNDPVEPEQVSELTVTPGSGGPGTTVTVSQVVRPVCGTFTVRFDGVVMGEDDASDGRGEVKFQVPADASGREHTIEARCRRGGGGGGSATFQLEGPTTTTTHEVPTTEEPGETTTTEGGSGIPTTTTTEGDAPIPQDIETCEAEAGRAQAEARYEAQRSMVLGRTYEVTAELSLGDVQTHPTFEGSTTVVTIEGVRCTVSATLTGGDFDITPRSDEAQSFVGTRALVWSWDVRPRRDGDELELALAFQATVVQGGRSVPGRVTLYEATIDVNPQSQSALGRIWDDISGFLHDPIVASILAAVLVAALLSLGPRAYRNVRARYGRRPSAGPGAGPSVPPTPPE
jgi:hypothetical protein